MQKKIYPFSSGKTTVYFDTELAYLDKLADKDFSVFITDQHIADRYKKYFKQRRTIVLPAGESFKVQSTIDRVIEQFIAFGADRKTTVIGVGGGVVTDITGFAASIYMRGLPFGFVPSSILGMVDASIGGKNGIDVGVYKNLVGTIRQPSFLLYDISLLRSLPKEEWINGFAEVIKHAAIKDASLFKELEKHSLSFYQKDKKALGQLIRKNVMIKSAVVQKDESEQGDRKLLNFGHTLGHAVENMYALPHGNAVSIGMKAACLLSEELLNFKETARVSALLEKYGLPVDLSLDANRILETMKLDKKKTQQTMNYVLLEKIGKAVVKPIPMTQLEKLIYSISRAR